MPRRARLALLTAVVLWAISFVATKVALEAAPPLVVVSLRLLISALCFLPWIIKGGTKGLGGARGFGQLFMLSLFGAGLHYGLQTIGLQYTTASNASLYATTGPITILLLSAVIVGERITLRKAVGVALAMAGVLVVMGPEKLGSLELDAHIKGDLLVLASLVLWALFTVFGKKLTDKLGALRVTAWVTVIGAVLDGTGRVCTRPGSRASRFPSMTADAWIAIAFLGVACSFLATLLYFVALEMSESQKVGVYLYAIPPITAVVAAFYLGETITLNLVVGAILVIGGVALTERG